VTGLGAVLAAPRGAEAQQTGKVYRTGWPGIGRPTTPATLRSEDAFVPALRNCGFIEGQPPERQGLIASLARPDGNVTGMSEPTRRRSLRQDVPVSQENAAKGEAARPRQSEERQELAVGDHWPNAMTLFGVFALRYGPRLAR
jgi:hypothetical protein